MPFGGGLPTGLTSLIPLGSAAGYGVNQFNSLQNQQLARQLMQQRMGLDQQQARLEQQRANMEQNKFNYALWEEQYNLWLQQQQWHRQSAAFAAMGAASKDPTKAFAWNRAAQLAAVGAPKEAYAPIFAEASIADPYAELEKYAKAMQALSTASTTSAVGGMITGGAPAALPTYGTGVGAPGAGYSFGPGGGPAPSTPGYGGITPPAGVPGSLPGYTGPSIGGTTPPASSAGGAADTGTYLSPDGTKLWKGGKIYNVTPAG